MRMAEFAPVLPVELYPKLDEGRYHFVQAHTVYGNMRMTEWFLLRRTWGHEIILDNGTIELGKPDVNKLIEVADRIHPTTIVVPDMYRDMEMTLLLLEKWADHLKRLCERLMVVPHGRVFDEWALCFHTMRSSRLLHGHDVVYGLPKVLDSYMPGGRIEAVKLLVKSYGIRQDRIHLLGVWNSLDGVSAILKEFPYILGYDSTLPVAAGLQQQRLTMTSKKYSLTDHDWKMTADMISGEELRTCKYNIRLAKSLVHNAAHAPSGDGS